MVTACNKNPSLPGCPYTPPTDIFFVATDPDQAKQDIYSIEGKVAADGLKRAVYDAKYANLVDRYMSEVKAYNDAVAGDQRLQAACARNPSLPGCPYVPPPRPVPKLGADPTEAKQDIYSVVAREENDALARDLADAKAQRAAEWYAQQAAAAQAQADGQARIARACKNNPSLPGCPY